MSERKEFISYGSVDSNGAMSLYNKDLFLNKLRDYFPRTNIEVVVREKGKELTHPLRKYYFSVVVRGIQEGYLAMGEIKSRDWCDKHMRELFLYTEDIDYETGEYEKNIHTLRAGDTSVTVKMMKDFIDLCIIWAVQSLDWAIPYPNEELDFSDMTDHQNKINNQNLDNKSTM